MKKLITLIIIQFVVTAGAFGQNSFKKHYTIAGAYLDIDASVDNILQTSDQGYLMSGYIDDNVGNLLGFLLKVDEKGTKEWERFYYDFVFNHVVESGDNGFFVFGSQTSWSIGSSVTKFNSQGDVLWSKIVPNAAAGYSIDINQLNSDIIFSCSGGGGGNKLVCMDSVGNVRWAKSGIGRAASTLDGGYVFATESGGVINFIKYNAIGDTVWTKNYNDASWAFFYLTEVRRTLDGGFIIGGIVGADGCLIRTDSVGDTTWAKKYTDPFGSFELHEIVQLEDSSFVISHGSGGAAYGAGLTAIDNSGNIIWSREVQPYSTNNIGDVSISKTTDGGLVQYFYELVYPTFYGISLLKVNSEGLVCGEPPIDLPTSIGTTNPAVGVGDTLASDSISLSNYNLLEDIFFFNTISDFQVVTPPICLISVDSTSTQNKVVWEKPVTAAIDSFMVYREFGSGSYGIVGSVPYDSLSQFYDNTIGVNPNITSYRYKISAIDTCGNESQLSDYHETIHLTTNVGLSGEVNLIWDAYEGFSFSYYRILRDSTFSGDWELLDSVTSSNFTYSDNNPPSIGAAYMIEVVAPGTCTSTKAVNHNSSRSNKGTISGGSATLAPESAFLASTTQINTGQTVDFLDQSANDPSGWTWLFEGGTPAFSLAQHPVGITYDTPGMYDVTLIAANALGRDTLVKTDYIEVLPATSIQELVEQSVTLYPNPTNDRVTVELSELALPCNLEVIDLRGRTLHSHSISESGEQIDLTGLEHGIYFLSIRYAQGNIVKPVVVE